MKHILFEEDYKSFLAKVPDHSVDLVVTDPPYESLERHRKKGTTTRLSHSKASSNNWFKTIPNSDYGYLFEQLYRVLKPKSYAFAFVDDETRSVVEQAAKENGFWVWGAWIWVKTKQHPISYQGTPSQVADSCTRMGMGYHGRKTHENILVIEKRSAFQKQGNKNPSGKGRKLNDFSVKTVHFAPSPKGYPTQKPYSILQTLIRVASEQGEVVLDPFVGSGGTAAAACSLSRRSIVNDIRPGVSLRIGEYHPVPFPAYSKGPQKEFPQAFLLG